jgi:hypothetical protein
VTIPLFLGFSELIDGGNWGLDFSLLFAFRSNFAISRSASCALENTKTVTKCSSSDSSVLLGEKAGAEVSAAGMSQENPGPSQCRAP